MDLFGVGFAEAGLVFLLALILIGPQRFPEIARQAGRWYRTARTFTDSVMADVRAAVDEIEEEIAEQNDGVRPIQEFQNIRRDIAQIGEETAAAAGDESAASRLESTAGAESSTETPEAPATDDDEAGRSATGTGGG